jgi:hypothetical protein
MFQQLVAWFSNQTSPEKDICSSQAPHSIDSVAQFDDFFGSTAEELIESARQNFYFPQTYFLESTVNAEERFATPLFHWLHLFQV